MNQIRSSNTPVDDKSLHVVLGMKMDKDDFLQHYNKLAMREETENIKSQLKIISDLLKHSIVLLNEAIRMNANRGLESQNASDAKVTNLLRQVKALVNWINKSEKEDLGMQGTS